MNNTVLFVGEDENAIKMFVWHSELSHNNYNSYKRLSTKNKEKRYTGIFTSLPIHDLTSPLNPIHTQGPSMCSCSYSKIMDPDIEAGSERTSVIFQVPVLDADTHITLAYVRINWDWTNL